MERTAARDGRGDSQFGVWAIQVAIQRAGDHQTIHSLVICICLCSFLARFLAPRHPGIRRNTKIFSAYVLPKCTAAGALRLRPRHKLDGLRLDPTCVTQC